MPETALLHRKAQFSFSRQLNLFRTFLPDELFIAAPRNFSNARPRAQHYRGEREKKLKAAQRSMAFDPRRSGASQKPGWHRVLRLFSIGRSRRRLPWKGACAPDDPAAPISRAVSRVRRCVPKRCHLTRGKLRRKVRRA